MSSSHAVVSASNAGKRTKRKAKEPPPPPLEETLDPAVEDPQDPDAALGEGAEEEEAGITRCVCDGLGPPCTFLPYRAFSLADMSSDSLCSR